MFKSGLFGASINEIQNQIKQPSSPTASAKSISSYKCPNPRRESASEGEFGSRRKYGGRNRSRTRRDGNALENKKTDSDSENEKMNLKNKENNPPEEVVHRTSGRHRRHRSGSKGSTKTSHPDWSNLPQQNTESKLYKHRKR